MEFVRADLWNYPGFFSFLIPKFIVLKLETQVVIIHSLTMNVSQFSPVPWLRTRLSKYWTLVAEA